jgi:hypothetical protein
VLDGHFRPLHILIAPAAVIAVEKFEALFDFLSFER